MDNELYYTLLQSASRASLCRSWMLHSPFTMAGAEYKNRRGIEEDRSYDALVTISQHSELSRSQKVCPRIIEHAPKEFVQMLISHFKGGKTKSKQQKMIKRLYLRWDPGDDVGENVGLGSLSDLRTLSNRRCRGTNWQSSRKYRIAIVSFGTSKRRSRHTVQPVNSEEYRM